MANRFQVLRLDKQAVIHPIDHLLPIDTIQVIDLHDKLLALGLGLLSIAVNAGVMIPLQTGSALARAKPQPPERGANLRARSIGKTLAL
jgi:hypothetical protein